MKSIRGVGLACTLTCLDEHRLARYDGCFQRELALPISTPRMTPGSRTLARSSNEHSLTVLVLIDYRTFADSASSAYLICNLQFADSANYEARDAHTYAPGLLLLNHQLYRARTSAILSRAMNADPRNFSAV